MTWAFQDVGVYVNLEEEGDVEGVDEVVVMPFAEAFDTSYIGAYSVDRVGSSMRANQAFVASEVASVVAFAEVGGACLTVDRCEDDAQAVGLIDQRGCQNLAHPVSEDLNH